MHQNDQEVWSMSVLDRIAYLQGRRDEVPNQELAGELVGSNDSAGIKEVAENLFNKDDNIRNDCIKVLYEVGYIKPEMISSYALDFIRLLKGRNNRMVWGAMLALSTIATLRADELYKNLEILLKTMEEGSVIAVDNAVKVLAAIASVSDEYNKAIFPHLIAHLGKCRPKEVGQHAESTFIAVNRENRAEFKQTLTDREDSLTSAQLARIRKLYKKL